MKYLIVYESKTGNTRFLAETLHLFLKDEVGKNVSIEIMTVSEFNDAPVDADVYFVGFGTNRGSCSLAVTDALEYMEKKKIVLFGTCGMGNSPEYYKQIEKKVSVWIPDDSENMGFFLCQGKMPEQIKEKYENMEGSVPESQRLEILRQYENGKDHPDDADVDNFIQFIEEILVGL